MWAVHYSRVLVGLSLVAGTAMFLLVTRGSQPRESPPDLRMRVRVVALVALVGGLAMTLSADSVPIRLLSQRSSALVPVSRWRQLFDRDAAHLDEDSVVRSRSRDSRDFYTLAYAIDAFTAMYEATGLTEYLDRALAYVDGMISSARPSVSLPSSSFHDGYLGWVSQQQGTDHDEVPLYESYAWRYVSRMLRGIREGPLHADPDYRAHYEQLLRFTEINIFEKWYTRGANNFIYRNRTHMASHWAYIAHELVILTSDEQRRARYRTVAENIDHHLPNYDSSLRGQLRASENDPDAYWWSDVWGEIIGPGQDIAHGNGVVSYIVEAHDSGGGWTDTDMARFCQTLTTLVIGSNGEYPEYVDGSGSGNGWLADGFVKLGRYDERVQLKLQDYGVQNAQFYSAMAVNARILTRGGK
ncbi:MAG: hypothetical protein JWL98_1256 [Xanthomonadaceae bacterium]|nr:hypothetical protein [Xanthomonadaceae bacterium]